MYNISGLYMETVTPQMIKRIMKANQWTSAEFIRVFYDKTNVMLSPGTVSRWINGKGAIGKSYQYALYRTFFSNDTQKTRKN